MRKDPVVNMLVQTPSRKKLIPGDIFCIRFPECTFAWGRIIKTNLNIGAFPNCILIYIYNSFSSSASEIPVLNRDDLMFPPKMINRLPWSKGYFMNLQQLPLGPQDVLKQHCFEDERFGTPRYFDELEKPLIRRSEPCCFRGLSSYAVIDILISQKLGLPIHDD